MLTLSVVMAALCYLCSSGSNRPHTYLIQAGWAHSALTIIVGLTWGYGAILVSITNDFNMLAVYSLALGGTALGAVSSQHAVPRSAFLSVWTSVPLLALSHVAEAQDLPMGVMVLLFGLILSMLTVRMHRFLATNYNLTMSLDAKVSELTETTGLLEAARRDAEEANLSKSRFLAQASHDLRQPIHAIGLLAASLRDTRLNKEQKQILYSIERSVESVTGLFSSLLDISRLDVGGVEPRPTALDLGRFLDSLVAQNRDLAKRQKCTFSSVGTNAWVHTDAALLFTMVQNTLGNAFKYASGSRVLIGPRRIRGKLALQICDTGPGIEERYLDAVFNEFYRLEGDHIGGNIEGMGLGLSIIRGLGELLGLEVILTSTVGRGTSVLISGFDQVEPVAARPTRERHIHPLSGKRICLIDDDKPVRAATSQLLERWGCQVEAFSGSESIEGTFDAILADMVLEGEKSGLDIVMDMRNSTGHAVPAVILTGYDNDDISRRVSHADLPVLRKPVRPTELRAMLTRLCIGL